MKRCFRAVSRLGKSTDLQSLALVGYGGHHGESFNKSHGFDGAADIDIDIARPSHCLALVSSRSVSSPLLFSERCPTPNAQRPAESPQAKRNSSLSLASHSALRSTPRPLPSPPHLPPPTATSPPQTPPSLSPSPSPPFPLPAVSGARSTSASAPYRACRTCSWATRGTTC